MKKLVFILFLALVSFSAKSQVISPPDVSGLNPVEQVPVFPGGVDKFMAYMKSNLKCQAIQATFMAG